MFFILPYRLRIVDKSVEINFHLIFINLQDVNHNCERECQIKIIVVQCYILEVKASYNDLLLAGITK